jgi:uncharacterized protein (DUF2141 family)
MTRIVPHVAGFSAAIAALFTGGWQRPVAQTPTDGAVLVRMDGFHNRNGRAQIALFNGDNGFPNATNALRKASATIQDGAIVVRFESLPYGTYAISMYHDENEDGTLNKGLFGIPAEGYGFSNNVTHRTRAARFKEASFTLNSPVVEIDIHVHY